MDGDYGTMCGCSEAVLGTVSMSIGDHFFCVYIYISPPPTVILGFVHIALVTSQMKEGKFIVSQKPITLTHPNPVQYTLHLAVHSGVENSLQPTLFTHFNNLPLPLWGAHLIECHAKVVKIPAVYSKESGFKSWS